MTESCFVGELLWTSVGWIGEEETIFLQNEWKLFRSRRCGSKKFEIGNRWLAVCWCLDFSITETSRLRKKREWKGKYVYRYVYVYCTWCTARQKRYASKKIRRKQTKRRRHNNIFHLFFYSTNPINTLHKKRNNHEGTWHCRFCNHTILLSRFFVPCIMQTSWKQHT